MHTKYHVCTDKQTLLRRQKFNLKFYRLDQTKSSPCNALRWGYSNAAMVPSVRVWFRPSVRGPCEHETTSLHVSLSNLSDMLTMVRG